MIVRPKHPLIETHAVALPAKSGLGYNQPIPVDSMCFYEAELCLRIQGKWYVFSTKYGGPIKIKYDEKIDVLEQWYSANTEE